MKSVKFEHVEVTRLVTGSNQFSGFSHQGPLRDKEMMQYYTVARIKDALRKAEKAGINTLFARSDNFVMRVLLEYWEEGGKIQWFSQIAPELNDPFQAIRRSAEWGAKGVYIHGGQVDYWYANREYDKLEQALEIMRQCNVVAGFAAHVVAAHAWIRDNLDPDFQMCSYYNPSSRDNNPQHVSTCLEKWDERHRAEMAALIQTIPRPVVHYKVFAGGNKSLAEGWQFLAKTMRETDIVCIGHHLKCNPDMLAENVRTFERIQGGQSY